MIGDSANWYFYAPDNRIAEIYPSSSCGYQRSQPLHCSLSGVACCNV